MANKQVFASRKQQLPKANARNEAGGPAYRLSARHTLAQYAMTGCLNSTFYADAETQLQTVIDLCNAVQPEWIAKVAVHAREHGYMKDMPALLCAILASRSLPLLERIFDRVIDNGRMLRTFVQILRSGVTGRRSLGSAPKRLVREWLDRRTHDQLFRDSVGQSPSLGDIVRMTHPKPKTSAREAFYGYLTGKQPSPEALPQIVRHYEQFKAGERLDVPNVSFQLLTSLDLSRNEWREIARNASWQMTRMNLNTFARHGVFESEELVDMIARRLQNPEGIAGARAFPYQLLSAALAAGEEAPEQIRAALENAMECAVSNVPLIEGKVYVCLDVSGSMNSPITGRRKGATTAVRAVDAAALMAAAVLRRNPQAEVLPFDTGVVKLDLDASARVMENARRLAAVGGGGTNCSAPLRLLNERQAHGSVAIYVSDNESWIDADRGRGTATLQEWNAFRSRNRRAKLVCIDVQPYGTVQAMDRPDIMNIGGFSDHVFDLVALFCSRQWEEDRWIEVIAKTKL